MDAQQTSTVIDVVTAAVQIRASLDGSHRHIQKVALLGEPDFLAMVDHYVFFVLALFRLDHTSENHDLLAFYLDCSSMQDLEFGVVRDVINSFPYVSFDVERLHLLHERIGLFFANSRLWLQTLATNDEDILLIELANAESLSRLFKVWQHNPLFAVQ